MDSLNSRQLSNNLVQVNMMPKKSKEKQEWYYKSSDVRTLKNLLLNKSNEKMSKLSESIFLIFQKLTKDWKQPGKHLVTYMRKPVPERTQKAWPNNSLIRRLVWINFLKRSQELLFKTKENAPPNLFQR